MTRYYRDLHDRELLSQAELLVGELHRRRLIDVRFPATRDPDAEELCRCPVQAIARNGMILSVVVDHSFELVDDLLPERALAGT